MNMYELHHGDCIAIMRGMAGASVDAIVTDPPYELGFMGKHWDNTGIAYSVEMWREALRVLKPGGHLLAFSGSRTYHRMTCAIEDAGFDIRDQIMWVYGSGFPKSLDVSKAIDKEAGAERELTRAGTVQRNGYGDDWGTGPSYTRPRYDAPATDAACQWQGWGTALKPAHEPICMARKPLIGTVAANVLQHGTGAINVDGCRVDGGARPLRLNDGAKDGNGFGNKGSGIASGDTSIGRWPANLIHDGSDEVLACFPWSKDGVAGARTGQGGEVMKTGFGAQAAFGGYGCEGSAARFFYCAKASKADRDEGNTHPTVKPTGLMRYLCRLVTPPGGLVLDPFLGSGSTGKAAVQEGFRFVGIELHEEHLVIARARITDAACMGYA